MWAVVLLRDAFVSSRSDLTHLEEVSATFICPLRGRRGGDRVRIDCQYTKVKRKGQLGSDVLKATGGNAQWWSFANLEGRLALGNVTTVFTSGRIDLAPLTCSWIWLEASLPLCTTLIQISLMLHCRPSLTVFCHAQSFSLKQIRKVVHASRCLF